MIIVNENDKLLKLWRVKVDLELEETVSCLFFIEEEAQTLLKSYHEYVYFKDGTLGLITQVDFCQTLKNSFDNKSLMEISEPVSFKYSKYLEMGEPRFILKKRTISYKPLKNKVECKENERILAVGRVNFERFKIEEIKSKSGKEARKALELSDDSGDFYYDNNWLGTISQVEFYPLIRNSIDFSANPLTFNFPEYIELGKPEIRRVKYLLEEIIDSYEPLSMKRE